MAGILPTEDELILSKISRIGKTELFVVGEFGGLRIHVCSNNSSFDHVTW